jgi:hypothetical protein
VLRTTNVACSLCGGGQYRQYLVIPLYLHHPRGRHSQLTPLAHRLFPSIQGTTVVVVNQPTMPALYPTPPNPASQAVAYPETSRRTNLLIVIAVAFFFVFFVVPSFGKDYRQETQTFLRSKGVSNDEVDKYVPKTRAELIAAKEMEAQRLVILEYELSLVRKVILSSDSQTGSLTPEEIAFLKEREAAAVNIEGGGEEAAASPVKGLPIVPVSGAAVNKPPINPPPFSSKPSTSITKDVTKSS